ncbi:MAG: tRNA uridine-5-carboxymethylaminomethyl(34) synthesis GTPase MnmE, partial [Rhodospirillales bacterium]|nr:tRNA uridine-5-carboxymethylaminomethyl(34) synthesis GTPase MnmE [Rhodospirillales bacterium]
MAGDAGTIFAVSTGSGRAGIAVIRLSGPSALKAVSSFTGLTDIPPRKATRVTLTDPESEETLDDGLVLVFPQPKSFTGEDVAELHVHGSRAVLDDVMLALSRQPALRPAEAGEFSRRAFDNGKLDLTAAEGLADLINAETTAQRRQAQRQLRGDLAALYDDWRDRLMKAIALFEAEIDFSDEELPRGLRDEVDAAVKVLETEIKGHVADPDRGRRVRDGFYITVLGAPNVGKSSLVNRLSKRDVAIVSEVAGTTRDVVEVHLDLGGFPVIVADTAGLRDGSDVIENEGIRRARERAETADYRVVLFDGTQLHDLDSETVKMAHALDTVAVITKSDLMGSGWTLPAELPAPVLVSSKTGEGVEELVERLRVNVENRHGGSAAPVLTRTRHLLALHDCLSGLSGYQQAAEV